LMIAATDQIYLNIRQFIGGQRLSLTFRLYLLYFYTSLLLFHGLLTLPRIHNGVMIREMAIQVQPTRMYLCYFNKETFFAKRDFLRAALFLCMRPCAAILSMTDTASLKAYGALSASFSVTERSTCLICDFKMPFLFRLTMVLRFVCRIAFFADFCCAMNNSCT